MTRIGISTESVDNALTNTSEISESKREISPRLRMERVEERMAS